MSKLFIEKVSVVVVAKRSVNVVRFVVMEGNITAIIRAEIHSVNIINDVDI
jgi:hypothetical protein